MRALLCAITLLLLAGYSFGQKIPHIYQIRADTVRIYNTCDTAELVLENRTKDTLGFLFNKGKGRTEFQRLNLQRIGASQLAIQGQDTVDLNFSSYGDTRYDLLSTNFVKITPGDSLTFSQWPNRKVVGYDAYNSPDMPAISNQANPGATGKLYYNGLVVRDEDSGFDLAVNWNGELNGPNGAFIRTKDDTKSAWSKWRELLFKDYADTTYAPKDSETLQSVTSRGNSTNQNIMFAGTPASSAGLSWNFNSDVWRIFVESPQDTPAGDMIFESADNDQEGWIFRSKDGTTPKQVLNIQPEGTFTFLGNNILHAGNHVAGSAFTPTLTGANVLSTITTNASGHVTALTTRALTAADIGAAPATASGNYIQNQTAADQSSSGFRISGIGRSNSQFQIVKDGSNTAASAFQLYNAASTRGANIQLDANTNPGLNFWVHDGTTWQNRLTLEADGKVGIGTADPILGVHIKNSTGGIILEANKPFATTSGGLFEAYNSGTPSAANQRLGGITMGALTNGTELRPSSQIDVLTAAAWSNDTSQSSYMRFMTTAIGAKQPAERMRIGADGTITMFNIPALGIAGTNFLTSNGGVIASRTAAQVLADLGAAPASTSGNYVQNLAVASGVQTANFSINGTGYAGTALGTPMVYSNNSAGQLNLVGGATGASSLRGGEIVLLGGSWGTTPGEILFRTGTGGSGAQQPERMRIDAAGNVGIGTVNPSAKLAFGMSDVIGEIGRIGFDVAEAQRAYIAANRHTATGQLTDISMGTMGAERLRINYAGDVGIGTAAPAARLEVRDTSTVANTTESILSRHIGDLNFRLEARKGAAANGTGLVTGKFGMTYNGTENAMINFHRGAGSTGGFLSFSTNDGTERMRIDGAGNIGIGTATPLAKLTVSGTSTSEMFVMNTTAFGGNTGAFARFYNAGTPTAANQVTGGILMGTNPSSGVYRTGAQIEARSDAAWTDGSSHPSNLIFYTVPSGSTVVTERMRIDPDGNLGIGTVNPTTKLEVNGATMVTGGANLSLKAASNDPGDLIFTDASNVEYSRIYNTAGGAALHLSTGSTPTPRLTVTSAGNVGIATTAPSTTLHVNGSFRASGVADLLSTSYIRGIGAQDVANVSYIRFMDNTATFRKGYVGDASNGNNDMYLTSDSGGVRLVPLAGASGSLNVQGTSMDYNGGQFYLNNSTNNQVLFNTTGIDEPSFTTRSKGTKVILFPAVNASLVDYALGIDTSHLWASVPQNTSTVGFKWYGGTTQIARLDGTGNLTLSGQVQATSFFQSSLRSLKKDIQPFTASALKIFEKVQVRTFKFKADASGKTNIGFIADEVPDEMATPKRNGVDQASTVALLVKAVQELTEQNKALQEKISQLEAKMKDK